MFRFDPILILFTISSLLMVALAWSAWQRRGRTPARYFALFLVGPIIWNSFFIFEIAATGLDTKLDLANLQFIGIDVIPIGLLGLLLAYTGQVNRFKYWLLASLAFPLVNQLIIWSNPWHHLFRVNPQLDTTSASFPILVNNYGPLFYLLQLPFTYLSVLFGLVLMVKTLRKARGAYHQQILVLIIGTVLPLLVDLGYTGGFSLIPNFNMTSVAFCGSGMLFFWSLHHYRFLDVMPVARGKLIETLRDPWFVLDLSGRLVDMNPVAERLVKANSIEGLGKQYEQVLAEFPALIRYLKEVGTSYSPTELNLDKDGLHHTYEVRLYPLMNRRENLTGKLLMLQDITRRKQLEDDREQAQRALRESEELFSTFMDNLPVPAFIQDEKNSHLYVNAAFEQMFGEGWNGRPAPRLMKQDIARLIFRDRRRPVAGGALNGANLPPAEGPQLSEQEITDAHGITRIMQSTSFPLQQQGKPGLVGGFVHDISELKNIQRNLENKSNEMERLANIDSLSGLFNRRYFDKAFAREVALAEYSGAPLAIGILDIDLFKQVNDNFGHARGDEVIIEVARVLLCGVRSADTVGRFGGEEFVILFPHTTLEDAWNVMERLRQMIEKDPVSAFLNVTVSGGVTAWNRGDKPYETLERADRLLYQAKEAGRNIILL